jgi:hypothetical protein
MTLGEYFTAALVMTIQAFVRPAVRKATAKPKEGA